MHLRFTTLLAILLSIVCGVFLGVIAHQRLGSSGTPELDLPAFEAALRRVQRNYVEPLSDTELFESALNGLMDRLDPHSQYLNAAAVDALEVETTGRFGGIGIELGVSQGQFTVVSPLDGTPAARAGVQAGDQLLAIDDQPLRRQRLAEVIDRMRGEPGSEVALKLRRAGAEFKLELVRETISIDSVSHRWLEPGIAYLRIRQFQSDTGYEFRRAIRRLQRDHEQSGSPTAVRGLILDLRNNPGGVLQASVTVADALLSEGLIVTTRGRLPSSRSRYRAAGRDLLDGAPVIALINGGSASAAEIVAGALKDHQRATLIGERSYGKGSVQTLVSLGDQRAVKLTTAYYLTPNGESIHQRGIAPDISFADDGTINDFDTALLEEAVYRIRQTIADATKRHEDGSELLARQPE
ncbi:MAG: S41 family peptidase [Pseudomonadota bacterium]